MCRKRQTCFQITHNDDDASDNVQIYINTDGLVCLNLFVLLTVLSAWGAVTYFCITVAICYAIDDDCYLTFMEWLSGVLGAVLSLVIFMMSLAAITAVVDKSHVCDNCAAKAKKINA